LRQALRFHSGKFNILIFRLTQALEVSPNGFFILENIPKSKKIDFSSLTPAEIKSIKNTGTVNHFV